MIGSVRGKAKGDTTRRRRAPIRAVTAVLAAAAFALGATSAMADPSAPVIDPAQTSPASAAPAAVSIDPAAATTLTPVDPTQVPPGPVAPPVDPAATPVANVPPPVDPAATPPPVVTTPPPAPPADPAPDQLSPALLAQVNSAAIDQAAPSKPSADIPPAITPTRTTGDGVGPSLAARPATPPPIGDVPPATLVNTRKGVPRLAPLVPSLVPVATAGTGRAAAAAHREATVTRAGPVWHQFIWRDAGTGTDSTNLGTRALLAIIGILPFAPVDGPDRTVPPASQLALLIPVLALAGFLFATRPIDEPRRRAPHRYRAVALKPG